MKTLPFANLPEIQFVDTDAETCRNKVITGFEKTTGRTLYPGNPERLFLEGLAYVLAVFAGQVEYAGRQGLVAYAEKGHLDHLGAESGTPRLGILPAATILRFSLTGPLTWDVEILGGTRVSTQDRKAVFTTDAYAVIPAGQSYVDVTATAMEAGAAANGLVPGQVNALVDPRPYIVAVTNLTRTASGTDQESDDDYRQRIPAARESYTCAGPRGQYEDMVKRVHKDIADAGVYSPTPGTVGICPIMRGGALPSEDVLEAIRVALSPDHVRPLTDTVIVRAPEEVPYTIEYQWYLVKENAPLAGSISAAVATAEEEYVRWQHSKPGRDINPDELRNRIKRTGVKRVEMPSPEFLTLEPYQIARVTIRNGSFGGLEDE